MNTKPSKTADTHAGKELIGCWVAPETKAAFAALARKQDRPVSALLRRLIMRELDY